MIWTHTISNLLIYHRLHQPNSIRIFKTGTKFDKERSFYQAFPPVDHSFFQILGTKEAMARKHMMNPYFSPEAIRRGEPLIQKFTTKFLTILEKSALAAEPVNMSMGFKCLAADTNMNFNFQKPLGALDAPDFDFPLVRATDASIKDVQWVMYFPKMFRSLFDAVDLLPRKLIDRFFEPLAQMKSLVTVRPLSKGPLRSELIMIRPLETAFWNSRNALPLIGFLQSSTPCCIPTSKRASSPPRLRSSPQTLCSYLSQARIPQHTISSWQHTVS